MDVECADAAGMQVILVTEQDDHFTVGSGQTGGNGECQGAFVFSRGSEVSYNVGVVQLFTGIFAFSNGCGCLQLYEGCLEGALSFCEGKVDGDSVAGAMGGGVDRGIDGMGQLVFDGGPDAGFVGAYQLHFPVDDDLGSKNVGHRADGCIVFLLPEGVVGFAEGVFPAQAVPVIDMEAQQVYARWIAFGKGSRQLIGGGAAGAAFGSEELDQGEAVGVRRERGGDGE